MTSDKSGPTVYTSSYLLGTRCMCMWTDVKLVLSVSIAWSSDYINTVQVAIYTTNLK